MQAVRFRCVSAALLRDLYGYDLVLKLRRCPFTFTSTVIVRNIRIVLHEMGKLCLDAGFDHW